MDVVKKIDSRGHEWKHKLELWAPKPTRTDNKSEHKYRILTATQGMVALAWCVLHCHSVRGVSSFLQDGMAQCLWSSRAGLSIPLWGIPSILRVRGWKSLVNQHVLLHSVQIQRSWSFTTGFVCFRAPCCWLTCVSPGPSVPQFDKLYWIFSDLNFVQIWWLFWDLLQTNGCSSGPTLELQSGPGSHSSLRRRGGGYKRFDCSGNLIWLHFLPTDPFSLSEPRVAHCLN